MQIRRAETSDEEALARIRRRAILGLAVPAMSMEQAEKWAARAAEDRMARALREHDVWVAVDGAAMGWVEVDRDRVAALYVSPPCSRRGVGSVLLAHAETSIQSSGYAMVRLESSLNALDFYLRRGYVRCGLPDAEGAYPLRKDLTDRGHTQPLERRYAPVNGISMYYEVHGRGGEVPLVLLHGGGSTIEVTFSKVLPVFAAGRTVIAVEEQGHGRTTDRDAPVRFESSADDVAALLNSLKVDKTDILGFSNGASVGLQVAIRHPQLVRKLVFASSITKRDGAHPQLWEFMKQAQFSNMPQPLKDAFLRVNPDERQLRTMHDKDAERMRNFRDVPDDLLRSLQAPTLIVLGDQDIVRLEHAVELTRVIPKARLLILPGGHGDYLGEAVMTQANTRYPELSARLIEEFLDSRA
jgi:pimeloyl-ACP methyl ester carboxylesterase/GNAT superfamily N-acetyltransferase